MWDTQAGVAEPPNTHPLTYIFLPLLLSPGPFLGHPQQEEEEAFEASQGSETSGWTFEE